MGKSVYQIVTERILEKMNQGEIPWRKPWIKDGAVSWDRQKPYRGINAILLEPGEYATFKAIEKVGGRVKKGEKGQMVVFWKWIEKENEETGKEEKFPILRYYKVFEINSQVEGLESKRKEESFEHDPISEAEAVLTGFETGPRIEFKPGRACYSPPEDRVSIPEIEDFPHADEYYSTMFHELVHSTGHYKRLARPGVIEAQGFGSNPYAKEELVAEIGAAMLCGVTGISNERNQENSAAYLKAWSKQLKEDNKLIVQAAAQAQKAADHILGTEFESEK